jgi:hypothetical protein
MTLHEVTDAIDAQTWSLLDQVLPHGKRIESIEDVREQLGDLLQLDGTEAIDLSLEDRLNLIEEHAAGLDLGIGTVSADTLRIRIEELACVIISRLGEERAQEALQDLERFVDEQDLRASDMTRENHYEELPHNAERSEGEQCTVYEYRCVEGLDVDIYAYHVGAGFIIYFEKRV